MDYALDTVYVLCPSCSKRLEVIENHKHPVNVQQWCKPVGSKSVGFTYLVLDEDRKAYKIGFSTDPQKRFKTHKTSNIKLRLIGFMPGSKKNEHLLHNKFGSYRIEREWFAAADEILDFFTNHPRFTKCY